MYPLAFSSENWPRQRSKGTPQPKQNNTGEGAFRFDLSPKSSRYRSNIPLNDSHYLLLELPFVSYPLNTEQVIVTLRQVRGLVPIIAHPERLDYFQQDPDALRKLIDLGALTQLTAGSLTGRFGSRSLQTSQIMLAHGWVHFLASDAHDNTYRTPNLSAALGAAVEMIGMEAAQALVAGNPQAVLDDREIEPEQPLRYEPKHRRWFFR